MKHIHQTDNAPIQVCASLRMLYFTYQPQFLMRPWVICPLYIFSAYPGPWNIHRRLFTKANFNNMNDYVCVNVHIFYTPIVCKSASFANILRRTL